MKGHLLNENEGGLSYYTIFTRGEFAMSHAAIVVADHVAVAALLSCSHDAD